MLDEHGENFVKYKLREMVGRIKRKAVEYLPKIKIKNGCFRRRAVGFETFRPNFQVLIEVGKVGNV